MSIVLSGTVSTADLISARGMGRKVLLTIPRIGTTLYVGEKCNDGRPITESWKYKEAMRLGLPIIRKVEAVEEVEEVEYTKERKQCWVEMYRPKTVDKIIGHRAEIQQIRAWLSHWNHGIPEKRGILVTGPPGIGKTTVIHVLAKEAGYTVTEYNASDTRSVGALRGMFALGVRRLRREVIVMDEVDGLSERGGVVEVATIVRQSTVPVFCIANVRGAKLKPLTAVCAEIRFNRPMRSTIATGLEHILRAEGVTGISKDDLEGLCERNGNDIRAVLNQLEFTSIAATSVANVSNVSNRDKDASHRMEPFSVTQRLFANKKMSWAEATDLVFVDYHLIPLMIQEAYVHAGRDDMEAVADAADALSRGDVMTRRVYQTQDWGLIPHALAQPIMAVKRVAGGAPFQIFPQLLGKRSKQQKQMRRMIDLGRGLALRSSRVVRLDMAESLRRMLSDLLLQKGVTSTVEAMDEMGITREGWEVLDETALLGKGEKEIEIPSKMRAAFTREWNKTHDEGDGIRRVVRNGSKGLKGSKGVIHVAEETNEQDEEEEEKENDDEWEDF